MGRDPKVVAKPSQVGRQFMSKARDFPKTTIVIIFHDETAALESLHC